MSRLRVVAVAVQLQAFVDDGDNLTPLPVDSIVVPFAQWEQFAAEGFAQAVDGLRQQVEGVTLDELSEIVGGEVEIVDSPDEVAEYCAAPHTPLI